MRLLRGNAWRLGVAIALACGAMTPAASAQRRGAEPPEQEIIQRFAQAESRLRDARNNYTFKQDVQLQTLAGSAVTGTFKRVSEIVFDDQSKRIERILYFPPSTLTSLQVTQEDLQDLGIIQPFALTAEELPKYNVRMVGREKIDEIDTYVFDIAPRDPKGMERRGERYLTGRVWVEDRDFYIVKVAGKAGPEVGKQRFPNFETYREQVDEFWFPTYTFSDDVLAFENQDVHIRMVVKYTDYKKFEGTLTVEPIEEP